MYYSLEDDLVVPSDLLPRSLLDSLRFKALTKLADTVVCRSSPKQERLKRCTRRAEARWVIING